MEFDKWIKSVSKGKRTNVAVEMAMREAWEAGVRNEREACAKVCEYIETACPSATAGWWPDQVLHRCAEAIRMRSNDRVEGRDAASSRRVPSHDGLEG